MSTDNTGANRLCDSSNRSRTDFESADSTLIGLKSRNREAAVRLEAALIAISVRDDRVGAEILLATAAELVDEPDGTPYVRASALDQASDSDVQEAVPEQPHGVTD